jgi:hypothetical protein
VGLRKVISVMWHKGHFPGAYFYTFCGPNYYFLTQGKFLGQKNLRKILEKFQVRVRVSFGCQKFQTYLNVNNKIDFCFGSHVWRGLNKKHF